MLSDTKFTVTTVISLAIIVFLWPGCENSIQPLDRETGIYSIYGTLDLKQETNFVRVKDLNKTLLEDTAGTINATVVLTDLNNGFQDIMQDSIIEFDGVKTHNFYTNMEILPGNRYRVSVERDDGRTVTADAITPEFANTNIEPVMETCETPIQVSFNPVEDRNNLSLSVGFNYKGELRWIPPRENIVTGPDDVDNSEKTEIFSFTPKSILDLFTGNTGLFSSDAEELWCHQLDNDQFYIRYTHYGSDFFENTTSDSIQIPGGTGRLGALYNDTLNFKIDTTNICKPNC